MPKYEGLCPVNIEVDLYTGCSFGCVYCVAKPRHAATAQPVAGVEELPRAVGDAQPSFQPYYLSPWTDAYQHREAEAGLTRRLLGKLARHDLPFFVVTKSDLVLRDREFFQGRDNAFVAISLNTLAEDVLRRLEPRAPSAGDRRRAIGKLLADGVRTVVKIDPILPGLTDERRLAELIAWLAEIRPTAVTAETARLSLPLAADLRQALTRAEYGRLLSFYPPLAAEPQHPRLPYRMELFRSLADFMSGHCLKMSFCRASLPETITPHDCRGGY